MPRFRMLALDIDGTLVNSRDEVSAATADALGSAAAAGIRVVLATGRRYSRTVPLVEPLGIDTPLITAGGALVKTPRDHHTVFRAQFAAATLLRTLRLIAELGHYPLVCADTYALGFDFYQPPRANLNSETEEYLQLNPGEGRILDDFFERPPEAFAAFVLGTKHQMLALEAALAAALPEELALHVLRSPRYRGYFCEIAPAGVTKWSAVRRIARMYGFGDEEICAVGDDVNDLPMIRGAGLGVAMGNAVEAVKQAADRVAPAHDDDGLAEIVGWLID